MCPAVPRLLSASQGAVTNVDLCFWALTCGAIELSKLMWGRCRCPLRAAVLAQEAAKRMKQLSPGTAAALTRVEDAYRDMALGVLDMLGLEVDLLPLEDAPRARAHARRARTGIPPTRARARGMHAQVDLNIVLARRLLLSKDGDFSRLGHPSGKRCSIFEVVMRFDNKDVASHELFQKVRPCSACRARARP